MAGNHDDAATATELNSAPDADDRLAFPETPVGDAEVEIKVDQETYEELVREYRKALDDGYTQPFDVYLTDHVNVADTVVTVEGERVSGDVGE